MPVTLMLSRKWDTNAEPYPRRFVPVMRMVRVGCAAFGVMAAMLPSASFANVGSETVEEPSSASTRTTAFAFAGPSGPRRAMT